MLKKFIGSVYGNFRKQRIVYSFLALFSTLVLAFSSLTQIPAAAQASTPVFSISANCAPNAVGVFVITNVGGDMTSPGTWTVNLNGTPIASNNFQLLAGASTNINTSGLFGTLDLFVSGGGSIGTATASMFCQSPTSTPTPVPPIFSLSANCTPDAQGTFAITNIGSSMTSPGSWTLNLNGTPIASNNFQLNANASTSINTSGLFGTLDLFVSGGGSVGTATVSTFCQSPTSTPTPVPPTISISASCTPDAQGTFVMTDTGSNMTGPATWTLNLNGTPIASNNFQLLAGASTSINTSGLFGTLDLFVSGGGTVGTATASTFCQSPTLTPTNTPAITDTLTDTVTSTPTATPTPTDTLISTNTSTPTQTSTDTLISTNTSIPTQTGTLISINTPTSTQTKTLKPTKTPTPTASNSLTPTATKKSEHHPTVTPTFTNVPTTTKRSEHHPTATATSTKKSEHHPTATPTHAASQTPTPRPTKTKQGDHKPTSPQIYTHTPGGDSGYSNNPGISVSVSTNGGLPPINMVDQLIQLLTRTWMALVLISTVIVIRLRFP